MKKTFEKIQKELNTNIHKQMFIIIVFGIIMMIPYFRNPFELWWDWSTNQLTINYSYGFVRRGFVGTITYGISQLFNIAYCDAINYVQLFGEVTFIILLFAYTYRVIKNTKNLAAGVFLFFSVNLLGFFVSNWADSDVYLVSLTILMLLLLQKDCCIWLIPILAGICECIHEGYALMYFCCIFSVMLYTTITEKNRSRKIYLWTVLILTGLIVSSLFLYFYFFSNNAIKTPYDEILQNTKAIIGKYTQEKNLSYIYNNGEGPMNAMWLNHKPTKEFYYRLFVVVINTLVCLPLIIKIVRFWKKYINKQKNVKDKLLHLLLPLTGFLIVPLIFLQTDEARWFYDFVFFEFFLITSIVMKKDENEIELCGDEFMFNFKNFLLLIFYLIAFMAPSKQFIQYWYVLLINP